MPSFIPIYICKYNMYVCMYVCMYCMYVCMFVCMYVCMYVYIYIYTHTYVHTHHTYFTIVTAFQPCNAFSHQVICHKCYGFRRLFLPSDVFYLTLFSASSYHGIACSSTSKLAGLHQSMVLVQLYVSIIQQSTDLIFIN